MREKRITGYSDVNTVTLDEILKERRIELNGEGHMAWDMWRNKKSVNNPKVGKSIIQTIGLFYLYHKLKLIHHTEL